MKTKLIPALKFNDEQINEVERKVKSANEPRNSKQVIAGNEVDFRSIEDKVEDNSSVPKVLVLVKTISRFIDSQYGGYKICQLVDKNGDILPLNLYNKFMDILEEPKVYIITRLKKIKMKTDGSVRLTTTNFTKVDIATKAQVDMFKEVKIAEHIIEGSCIMCTNITPYRSCLKHLIKLSELDECQGCEKIIPQDEVVLDFKFTLQIEEDPNIEMVSIVVLKKLIKIKKIDANEVAIEERIEEELDELVVGKDMKVDYDVSSYNDDNIAIRIEMKD